MKLEANEAQLIPFHPSRGTGKIPAPSLISNSLLLFHQNYFAHPELLKRNSALLTGDFRWEFPTENHPGKFLESCLKIPSSVCCSNSRSLTPENVFGNGMWPLGKGIRGPGVSWDPGEPNFQGC